MFVLVGPKHDEGVDRHVVTAAQKTAEVRHSDFAQVDHGIAQNSAQLVTDWVRLHPSILQNGSATGVHRSELLDDIATCASSRYAAYCSPSFACSHCWRLPAQDHTIDCSTEYHGEHMTHARQAPEATLDQSLLLQT